MSFKTRQHKHNVCKTYEQDNTSNNDYDKTKISAKKMVSTGHDALI